MKLSNLLDKDLKIVEKKKIFFLIPLAIIVIAAIAMLIYGLVSGEPVKLGMDFTGGYTVSVKLGTKLNDDNYEDYKKEVVNIVENLKDENGNGYGIKVSNVQRQGSDEKSAIYVKYKAVADEEVMEDVVNKKLTKELEQILKIIPTVKTEGNTLTFNYDFTFSVQSTYDEVKTSIKGELNKIGANVSSIEKTEDQRGIKIVCASMPAFTDAQMTSLKDAASIDDPSSGSVSEGSQISASFSSELLWSALAAILSSVVLMLIYIAFRFELLSGLSAVVALVHDIIIMFCFMVIFHIEINSTFIAALITILGYSINNTIIIFDRVRENKKSMFVSGMSASMIANKSVSETMLRSLNTTLTTLFTIGMVAIIGVQDIRVFALPIIVGLLSGLYSSICIAPSIWASWKDRKTKDLPGGNVKKDPGLKKEQELKKAAIAE